MNDIVDRHIRAAVTLGQARRFTEAKALLDDLQALNPGHPGIASAFGMLAIEMGDAAQAVDIFGAAASRAPGNAEHFANLATAYRLAGRREEAEASLERALLLAPGTARFWLLQAELMIERREGPAALDAVEKALRLAHEEPAVHRSAGLVLTALGVHDGAERAFRHAHALDPADVATQHNLASLLALLGRPDEALPFAESAFLADPTDVDLTRAYASRLAETGRLDEAVRAARRLLAALPDDVETAELVASLLIRRGEPAEALAVIGSLVRRQPRAPAALAALGRLLLESGRRADALVAAEQALTIEPSHEAAVILRRTVLLTLGRFDEALPAVADTTDVTDIVIDHQADLIETIIALRWHRTTDGNGTASIYCDEAQRALFCQITGATVAAPAGPPPMVAATPALLLRRGLGDGQGLPGPWPYCEATEAQVDPWTVALSEHDAPRIGVVWNRVRPGFTMAMMRDAVPDGVTAVSLALGSARRQLRDWPKALDGGAQIADPTDIIGALGALDGVVAVDGIALHLAGAMGRPAIAVVPVGAPWYWLEDDGRSQLYPSVRILRQSQAGRWDDTVGRLRTMIEDVWSVASPEIRVAAAS